MAVVGLWPPIRTRHREVVQHRCTMITAVRRSPVRLLTRPADDLTGSRARVLPAGIPQTAGPPLWLRPSGPRLFSALSWVAIKAIAWQIWAPEAFPGWVTCQPLAANAKEVW